MNFTAKSRYALKVMMDLALNHHDGQQTRLSISQRHGIPIDFMDQILARLKSANLIQTTRGRSGGIALNFIPSEISLWKIFRAVEDNLYPVQCLEVDGCAFDHECISKDIWTTIFAGIQSQLEGFSLEQAVVGHDFSVVEKNGLIQECKAPKRSSFEHSDS